MRTRIDNAEIDAFLRAHEPIEDPRLFCVGQIVGDWRICAFIGRGGSGEVYSARHTLLALTVALKVLSRDDAQARDRFKKEAQFLADNLLPAFPRFYGYGESDGIPYMALELLEQYPLPLTDRAVASYLQQVCVGVGHLHSLGLVHRDIKPQNVLRRAATDEPVLIDLGLVKDVNLPLTHRGESLSIVNGRAVGVGTPKYAAPEQFAGGEISPAADIHALGMLANECFGGHPHGAWVRIIRRSTSSIPSQRYGCVGEFSRAIRRRHMANLLRFVVQPIVICALILIGVMVGKRLPFERIVQDARSLDAVTIQKGEIKTNGVPSVTRLPDLPALDLKKEHAETNAVRSFDTLGQVNPGEKPEVPPKDFAEPGAKKSGNAAELKAKIESPAMPQGKKHLPGERSSIPSAAADVDVGGGIDAKRSDGVGKLRTGVRFIPNASERSGLADD